ncbi:hypothetical protein AB0H12_38395 [Actinosynnema sp. NPDC023794]
MMTSKKLNMSTQGLVAPIMGILILAGFGLFVLYMLGRLDLGETAWARAIYLFSGVEAVAFSAAGYFFGTQVQRGKVEEAKKEAQTAEQVKEAVTAAAKSERRASRVLAEGIVDSAGSGGGLMNDSSNSTLVAQARALLAD